MEKIKIIAADSRHFQSIQQIAHITWFPTFKNILSDEQIRYMLERMYSLEALAKQVSEQNHSFLLAVNENQEIGYASYELNYKNTLGTKIHKLYVLPAFQGKNIGKRFIEHIEKIALENQQTHLQLNVNRFNQAVHFYQKNNFEIIGSEDIDIGNNYLMEDFIMERKLRASII